MYGAASMYTYNGFNKSVTLKSGGIQISRNKYETGILQIYIMV